MDTEHLELVAGAVQRTPVSIVLTDPRLEDNPITYVNEAFQQITLYSREFAIGRNCRFLQGADTEPEMVEKIREGLKKGKEFEVTVTNHKADGTPFRNQLLIAPVFSEDGTLSAYFGVQREVDGTDADRIVHSLGLLRELQHRVKNHLAMVVSMIRLQASRPVTRESLRAVGRRVEALALLYEEMFHATMDQARGDTIRTGAYLSRIATVVARIGGTSGIRVNVNCEEVDLPVDQAARLGLLLSELLTNSLEHAFRGRDAGAINIQFKRLSGSAGVRLSVEDDGIGLPRDSDWPYGALSVQVQRHRAKHEQGKLDTTGHGGHSGVGGTIIVSLTEMLGAKLDVIRTQNGTTVTVDFKPES